MGATDSKLAFKKGVFRLFEERHIPPSANEYWEQFWSLPESAQDVFLLVGPQDIRRFRDEAGENLETLVDKTLAHLFRLVESPLFLTPHAPAQQVLNCIRILTRIFPFIFESPEKVDWEEKYFWTAQTIVVSGKRPNTSPEAERTTSKSNEQDAIQAKGVTQKDSITSHKEELLDLEEVITSNGQRLIETLQNLLFTSGFTLPTALDTTNRVSFVIWETGIGSSKPLGTTKELDDNRAEILRLLLVLFSKSIYVPPVAISATENKWIEALVTSNDRPATLATLCSLINSALKYNPSGWGLPYNHVMFGDQRDLLVMLSLQVVIVLLDYQVIEKSVPTIDTNSNSNNNRTKQLSSPPFSPPITTTPQRSMSSSHDHGIKNQYRYYLSRLHREQDFLFLIDGMYRILSNPMAANSVYLPGSTKVVKYHHETLILCWKTLELNKRFRAYLIETNRVLDILVILLYFCMEYKQDTTQLGLIRMCAYMLQTLSKDKTLSKSLNTTFDGHASLPNNIKIPNFHGTYGDYLICTVHNLVSTTKRTLRGSYLPLISTLANVSPYLKNISVLASSRLIQLCSLFASPSFLLSDESNHVLLSSLLDAVCSILYYQAADNPNLVYTLVQHETRIRSMANFTLQKGLTDIQRTRNHQLAQQELHTGNPSSSPTTTHHQHQQRGNNGRARRTSSSSQQQQQQQQKQYSRSSESSEKDVPQQSPNTGRRREISSSMGPLSPTDLSLSDGPLTSTGSSADIRNDDPVSNGSDNNRTDRKSSGIERDGDTKVKDNPSTASNSQPITTMSEKARGKLPERQSRTTRQAQQELEALHSSSLATEEPVSQNPKRGDNNVKSPPSSSRSKHDSNSLFADTSLQQANALFAADVGQNGFVPTEVWVTSWMRQMRYGPILALLQKVHPKITENTSNSTQVTRTDQEMLEYLTTNVIPSLSQILPEADRPTIYIRRFVWSELFVWFQGLMWSQVYIGGGGRLGRQGQGCWYETDVRLFSIRTYHPPNTNHHHHHNNSGMNTASSVAVAVSDNVASVAAAAIRVAGSSFISSSSSSNSSSSSSSFPSATTPTASSFASSSRRTSMASQPNSSSQRPSTTRRSSATMLSTATRTTNGQKKNM